MNEKEQKAADALLNKVLAAANAAEASLWAQAYATLAQVGFNRIHATPAKP